MSGVQKHSKRLTPEKARLHRDKSLAPPRPGCATWPLGQSSAPQQYCSTTARRRERLVERRSARGALLASAHRRKYNGNWEEPGHRGWADGPEKADRLIIRPRSSFVRRHATAPARRRRWRQRWGGFDGAIVSGRRNRRGLGQPPGGFSRCSSGAPAHRAPETRVDIIQSSLQQQQLSAARRRRVTFGSLTLRWRPSSCPRHCAQSPVPSGSPVSRS